MDELKVPLSENGGLMMVMDSESIDTVPETMGAVEVEGKAGREGEGEESGRGK